MHGGGWQCPAASRCPAPASGQRASPGLTTRGTVRMECAQGWLRPGGDPTAGLPQRSPGAPMPTGGTDAPKPQGFPSSENILGTDTMRFYSHAHSVDDAPGQPGEGTPSPEDQEPVPPGRSVGGPCSHHPDLARSIGNLVFLFLFRKRVLYPHRTLHLEGPKGRCDRPARSALVLSGGQDHCRPSQPTLITRLSPAAVWAVMVTPDTAEVARVQLEYFTQKASGLHRQSSKQSIIRLWNNMCVLNRFPEGKNEKKM